MVEVTGNLWTFPADVRVITTNGTVKKNGECVMGRGCAFEAKRMFPEVSFILGQMLKSGGNRVHVLRYADTLAQAVTQEKLEWLVTFPVKHNWYEKADLDLIRLSTGQLFTEANCHKWKSIVLPRPGCGNGQLSWADVKPILEPILDDRFHVITFEKGVVNHHE